MASINQESLTRSLRRLRSASHQDISSAVHEAVRACVALFQVSGSGLMIADEMNNLRYIAASDGPSRILETAQSEAGTGPCVEAFVSNDIVASDDLRTETRWPAVTPALTEHGVVSVLGSPLRLGGVPVGTLDVYLDKPHQWHESERAALSRYGEVIESTLSTALAAHQAGELADQLQYALDYRIVIERAVGFLMARHALDAVTAFDALRRQARDQRRKVAEVAQELLTSGDLDLRRR
ncbi:GAF and ANTAR domain-containing protein [Actinoplanes sp. M2I2]|uniref:GAF and ANTAR domain-containing protein n=1 Tax=Actinoplanes sp. M2I2 TaxID=1734444 RepID=UPI00201FE0E9|nr:GAF and ANTAR domain-containing protein [Actinoplanes sp. M2I2]